MFDLSSISSKTLYREFRSRKEIPWTAQAKFHVKDISTLTCLSIGKG